MLLDRKRLDTVVVDRSLVGVELLRAHPEDSPGQLDQLRQGAHEDDATRAEPGLGRSPVRVGITQRSPPRSDASISDQEQCAVIRPWRREATWGGGMTTGAQRLTYEIRVRGELTDALVAALQALNLHIEQTANGTILVGVFRDQAELHGALQAMQDFGVELVEVRQR
jgi:hypothetical protein